MLDTLEAIFFLLLPLVFIASIVNSIMMRKRMRKIRKMLLLMEQGRCTQCEHDIRNAVERCPQCGNPLPPGEIKTTESNC